MPPVSVMIKPASSACNLACRYCFYHSLAEKRESGCRGVMKTELFSEIMKKAFSFADGEAVTLSFQGGEPLLAGKEFFIKAFAEIERLNVKKSPVYIGVQTNGTLIDEEWCNIFASYGVLVGLSLDGDDYVDGLRIYPDGKESFSEALRGYEKLKRRGADINVLVVVTKQVAENIERIYDFFKEKGVKYLQYIPCLRPFDGEDYGLCLDGEEYGEFLIKAFNLYAKDYFGGRYVSVRIFDNFVSLAHGRRAEQCGMNGHCTHQYVIESDGEVYPCDFYCADEYSLGNIKANDFSEFEKKNTAVEFIKESLVKDEKCRRCNLYALCAGGCKRERLSFDLCVAYKKFLPYAVPILRRMY